MPKIIKDLEKKIIDSTMILIQTNDYDSIDMRLIAKSSNIAVGTLYNYFSNKKDLFSKLVIYSWQNTADSLNIIATSNLTPHEKIKEYMICFCSNMESRKGIGKRIFLEEILNNDSRSVENISSVENADLTSPYREFSSIKKSIVKELESLIIDALLKDDYCIDTERLAYSLIITASTINGEYPNDALVNVNFITHLLKVILN